MKKFLGITYILRYVMKYSTVGKPQMSAFNAVFIREKNSCVIVCKKALYILHGTLPIHNMLKPAMIFHALHILISMVPRLRCSSFSTKKTITFTF